MDDSRTASVVPLLRYRDCSLAIDWLERVFGFERHVVVGSDDGKIAYAQMTLGSGMIMLGPTNATDLDSHLKQPEEVGGASTQTCYIVVDDIEEHYERAKANGAEIVLDIKAGPFGSRGYSCRDLDGHIWNFGSYDPWQGKRQPVRAAPAVAKGERRTIKREVVVFFLCLSALVVTLSTVRNELLPPLQRLLDRPWTASDAEAAADQTRKAEATIEELRRSLFDAQSALTAANDDLAKERSARVLAEQSAGTSIEGIKEQVRREIEGERAAREQSEKQVQVTAADLSQEREARQAAERDALDLKTRLDTEIRARQAAESEVSKVRELLSRIESQPMPANAGAVSAGGTTTPLGGAGIRPRQWNAAAPPASRSKSQFRQQRRDRPKRDAKTISKPVPLTPQILVPYNHPIDYEGPYMNIF